jgi:hypothetical protein
LSNAAAPSVARFPRIAVVLLAISMTAALSSSVLADESAASVLGQSGSGGRAISVADVLGQSGSGGRGQSGSGGRAISIADVLGQSGSGGRGQSGSGGRAISVADVFGQSGSGGRAVLKSGAMGVVEQLTPSGQTSVVVVLGQEFALNNSTAGAISVGDYVLVTVDAADATTLQNLAEPYVAGVSPVGVMGVVAEVNARTASLVVGGASVDYSSQLVLNPGLLPAPGAVFEAVGTQPVPGGVVLAGLQYDGAVVTLSSHQ